MCAHQGVRGEALVAEGAEDGSVAAARHELVLAASGVVDWLAWRPD